MANNIVGGAPNAIVAKSTVSFATAGITALNTEIIYVVGNPLKSYVPGRAINGISGFEAGKGYYMVAKIDMDLETYVVPPLDGGEGTSGGLQPVLHGGASYTSDVPAAISENVKSLICDGSTGYASLISMINYPISASTISIWFKYTATGGVIVGRSNNPNSYIKVQSPTAIRVQGINSGEFFDYTVPSMSINTWYHLAYTQVGGTGRLYLNGTESSSGGHIVVSDMEIDQIGRYWDGSSGLWLPGQVAEYLTYDTALSGSDIAILAAGNSVAATPTAVYHLNDNP